jgi:hypothetical protein
MRAPGLPFELVVPSGFDKNRLASPFQRRSDVLIKATVGHGEPRTARLFNSSESSRCYFGCTMMFCGFAIVYGDPGAWLTLVGVAVKTNILLAVRAIP